jgi:branched-chain amino acid transport system ATP-binding protein
MATLLEARDLVVGYSEDLVILHGVSVGVEAGTITGMIGLNGAGKTTLLKAIYGFLRPKEGKVLLEGEEITGMPPHVLIHRGIWYLPQDSGLFPYLTVEDHLRIPLRPLGLSKQEARRRISGVFEQFPALAQKRKKKAGDLSGGQQKMLECAMALVVRPRLLLVDEPTVGLAPKVAGEMYDRIEGFLREGATIFMVDHNVRKLIEISSYIYVMSLGRITSQGPQEHFRGELKEQVRHWLGL